MIDADEIISKQLSIKEVTEVVFLDGRKTTLTPLRCVPQLEDQAMRLSLEGEWAVAKWPFSKTEELLVSPKAKTASWNRVMQPGPVFYYDPDANTSEIKNWDRVGLCHIHIEDGAVIRRTARIPRTWGNKRIYLRFDAIYPAGRVYLDGQFLGEHLSGLTPVEFDVTGRVKPGREVVVAVRLLRKHPFVKLDMPRHAIEFTGLSQHVYFHATAHVQIADYQLITQLDDSLRRGSVAGKVTLRNHSPKRAIGRLKVTLSDARGKRIASFNRRAAIDSAASSSSGDTASVDVDLEAQNVLLWNDEHPNLYTVTIALAIPGQKAQEMSYRTGFRRLHLSPKGAFLNGNPVKFRGVNHLTFHPETGMYTPEPWLRRSFDLMKKANINAIRTHFLSPPAVADLCDELGIYFLQELPVDWGTNYIHDPSWVGPALMRLEGGVRRDRHHPSIMVWSIGNENMPEKKEVADDGWNHLRIFEKLVKTLDPSRYTMFPPPGPANKVEGILELRVGDIADTHYSFKLVKTLHEKGRVMNPRAWDGTMEETTREEALGRGWKGVWFSSEYGICNMQPDLLGSPYISIISDVQEDVYSGKNSLQVFIDRLKREWGMMRNDPTCLGGAYFPWLCSGAGKGKDGNPWGWVRWGEDADWGVVTADLLPKPFFWALRVIFSPVYFSPDRVVWKKGERTIGIEVSNQYNSIDLKDCTLRTMMGGGGAYMGMMRDYKDIPVACRPGEKKVIEIPIWNQGSLTALENGSGICCRCILLDPRGFRPITKDILVMPEELLQARAAMPIGPDAVG